MALTKRQKEFLDFFAAFVDENGYCPSYEEIARGLDLSSLATVHKHVCALETKNYLRRGFNQSRSLELAPRYLQEHRRARPAAARGSPFWDGIAAGAPVEAIEQRGVLNFADFAGNGNTFALEVSGNSMIEDHICDGDMILLERVAQANDGDIVVALVAGSDATLKRFYREAGDMIRLQPANAAMKPIRFSWTGRLDSGPATGSTSEIQAGVRLRASRLRSVACICSPCSGPRSQSLLGNSRLGSRA